MFSPNVLLSPSRRMRTRRTRFFGSAVAGAGFVVPSDSVGKDDTMNCSFNATWTGLCYVPWKEGSVRELTMSLMTE